MRTVRRDGFRIAYEVVGEGPPLVLVHGFYGDRTTWRSGGHVDALAGGYRLILIDALGHGGSDTPHDAAPYRIDRQVEDVVAVLDAEGVQRTAYWGASMGGVIGLHLLARYPERLTCLVAGGAHACDVDADPAEVEAEAELFRGRGVAPFVDWLERQGTMPGWMREVILAADPQALAALTTAISRRRGVTGALAGTDVPVLLIAGDGDARLDEIRRTAEAVPSARLAELPGCGHSDAFLRLDLVLPLVRPFLEANGVG
ncbi:alpha/beta fold hydrolase [Actinomadura opuntiae]|uniref:alpha/beta fold hydrolase n=1 Tax=Actinomadura sp. OS1-43 TaxID=604315 RepID=UPI00255AAEDD|nr:alpha/beta hydrolase [Actinomadura sp. OS1-43]MDL4820590.1 alpha/beta hydrolase [Actinomadura sp. OS1-43]